ncbi:MAG: FAD-binding oxidoreductase [Kiloniellales bacterium]|nr:FAD-binding oxidoreductase [Kiloniellales bacterium]
MTSSVSCPETFAILGEKLEALLGNRGLLRDEESLAPYLLESRGRWRGWVPYMALPKSTEEVAETIKLCRAAGVAIVPQGGNTSRVGGALARKEDGAILLNLARMNKIIEVDPLDYSMTLEGGAVLQSVQEAADSVDRLFPLSLGAEGSCQIGGNLATNAGGIQVLRYGNARDLVLGLEVVLADGKVWNGLNSLRKNNVGYDMKQIFLGSEGTLGIITKAVLKLFPKPKESVSLFIGLSKLEAACEFLAMAQGVTGGQVVGCELIPRLALDFTLKHIPGVKDPLEAPHDWYLLMRATAGRENSGLQEAMESMLAEAFEAGLVSDAAIASSGAQDQALWRIREALVEAQPKEGASIKHDISVPVSKVPEFITRANTLVEKLVPGIRPYPFGHLGDGNIHYNLTQPLAMEPEAFFSRQTEIQKEVHDIALSLGGSISAEHGIGIVKKTELARVKDPLEIDLMRKIKKALDPEGLFNPGKIFDM